MGELEDIYEDLDTDASLEEFRSAVEEKVEQLGGLADEETAAMLIAHELDDGEVEGIADIEPGMEEVKFVAKVTSVGDLKTFERDGEDAEDGHVINVEVADETGSVRVAFWDEKARAADEELAVGDVLRIAGRPKDGYNGVEVNADTVEPDEETEVNVQTQDTYQVDDLSLGRSDVNLVGVVLDTDAVRTFDRDDGSEGRVANLTLGDSTGRVRVTLWDDKADRAEELESGVVVEVVDGYVRERDGDLELHVGDRGAVQEVDEDVSYEPDATDIEALEIDQTVDIAGVVRSSDPKRTFDRDDGSEGQVKNIRVQDETGDIRVALWGEKADRDISPGDTVALADVEIQDGWQDDLEASAGWQSSVTVLDVDADSGDLASGAGADGASTDASSETETTGLGAFEDGGADADTGAAGSGGTAESDGGGGSAGGRTTTAGGGGGSVAAAGERVEFTGTVVQAGNPVVLDSGEETMSVETSADVRLGEEVTVSGIRRDDGRLDADEVR